MLFWLICAILTVAVTVLTLRPLLRSGGEAAAEAEHDLRVYKDQLAELDRERDRSVIGPAEAQAARLEISRRILAASDAAKAAAAPRGVGTRARSLIFSVFSGAVVAGSLGLYMMFGSPGYRGRPYAERVSQPTATASVQELVARVEARLREAPDDGKGWDVLAPVYAKMGRYQDAIAAFARAIDLLGESRERLRGYAEAHLALANGVVVSEARDAFRKILAKEPDLIAPRFWLAVGQEQDGDRAGAKTAYETLLRDADEQIAAGKVPPRVRDVIQQRLAGIRGQQTAASSPAPGTQPVGENGEPSAADAIKRLPAGDRARMIQEMVAGLATRLEKDGGGREEWQRLIRSYWVLGRRNAALEALAGARRQFEGDEAELATLDAFARDLGVAP